MSTTLIPRSSYTLQLRRLWYVPPRRLYSTAPRGSHASTGVGNKIGSGKRGYWWGTGLVASSVACGALGYLFAQRRETQNSRLSASVPDSPSFGSAKDFEQAILELKDTFKESDTVSTDLDDLEVHGFSHNDYHPELLHSVITYPKSTEDVVKIIEIAVKYRMPVIPYSGGTSLEGHFRGHRVGGICVDMNNMDKILEINENDSDLICQPAARWMDINDTLKKKGIPLFFPIDPGPGATVGGMLSTGCSGTNAVRYGTAKGEWFLNATVVLPTGETIKTKRRSRKSAAGFDLTKLFAGAEGTLGIITEVTIRLAPLLPTNVAVVHFPDVKSATAASIEAIRLGVGIQCVELLDSVSMKATNNYGMSSRKWPEKDSLFFKFQGPSQASLKETATIVQKIVAKHGGTGFTLAANEVEAHDLWSDRKNLFYSALSLSDGSRGLSTDVCVPVSRLPDLINEARKDLASIGLISAITEDELKIAKDLARRIVNRAIAMDGTCTGEHGIGIGKKEYLVEELGEGTVNLMKTIKRAIDPHGLFNPGKLYPERQTALDPKKL